MIIKSAEFIKSAVKPAHYPSEDLPEIAFAGRSNVGKSSLINVLLNRKRLAKTSSTPGRTQLINFFVINETFSFVDIPGFGYAKVPRAVQKNWAPMVETYLSTRSTLKGIVLIVDIRRIPGAEELSLLDWLNHYQIPCILVATKIDKLNRSKQMAQRQRIAEVLSISSESLHMFSIKTRQGKKEMWRAIQGLPGMERV